jgi:hypothetical protein
MPPRSKKALVFGEMERLVRKHRLRSISPLLFVVAAVASVSERSRSRKHGREERARRRESEPIPRTAASSSTTHHPLTASPQPAPQLQ